jgi:hypothetical protein
MTTEDLLIKLYTLPVRKGDIVVLRHERPVAPEVAEACGRTLQVLLRQRGLENAVVVLQPGLSLSTVRDTPPRRR